MTLIVCNSKYRYMEKQLWRAVERETGSWWDGKLQIGRCIHRIIPSHQLHILPASSRICKNFWVNNLLANMFIVGVGLDHWQQES